MSKPFRQFARFIGLAALATLFIGNHLAIAGEVDPLQVRFAQERRAGYRDMIPLAGAPDAVAEVRAIEIPAAGPERKIPARLYVPQGADGIKPLPIVMFVHGGGYISGDLDTHDVMVRAMANGAKALVLAVDYRLAPEHPFPAGLEDVYASLQWVATHAGEIGADASRIAISGDSAGANLAAAATLLSRDRDGPKIAAQWLMYATLSNTMDTDSWKQLGDARFPTRPIMLRFIESYLPAGTDRNAPLTAPLSADHRDLPPALLQVGELDPLRDESIDYAQALQKSGAEARAVVYKGVGHGFIQYYKNPERNPQGEGAEAMQAGTAFLRQQLHARK